jgi:hypothetical protein
LNENLQIIYKKLDHLIRMRSDVGHSVGKMVGPLQKIQRGDIDGLTPDERETISAFTKRFGDYQEQIGKTMRSIAIEEESPINPFGAILALMEKLEILENSEKWKDVRELRNQASHEYEDDANELFQILNGMVENVPFLTRIHTKTQAFVDQNYAPPTPASDNALRPQ